MRPETRTGLIIAIALALAIPGVPAQDGSSDSGGSENQIRGFSATYLHVDSGTEFPWTLRYEPEIADDDGTIYDGYVLESIGPTYRYLTYLDENLIVFRADVIQKRHWSSETTLDYSMTFWAGGEFSTLGLDIPLQMDAQGFLRYHAGPTTLEIIPEVEVVPEGVWYRITKETLPPHTPRDAIHESEFLFSEGIPVPKEYSYPKEGYGGSRMELISFDWEDPLPTPDNPSRHADPVPKRPRESRLFPGEDQEAYGTGYTHLEHVDGMVLHDTLSGTHLMAPMLVSGACVVSYSTWPSELSTWPQPIEPLLGGHFLDTVGLQMPGTDIADLFYEIGYFGGPYPHYPDVRMTHWGFRSDSCSGVMEDMEPLLSLQDAEDLSEQFVPELDVRRLQYLFRPSWGRDFDDGANQYLLLYCRCAADDEPGYWWIMVNGDRGTVPYIERPIGESTFPPYHEPFRPEEEATAVPYRDQGTAPVDEGTFCPPGMESASGSCHGGPDTQIPPLSYPWADGTSPTGPPHE